MAVGVGISLLRQLFLFSNFPRKKDFMSTFRSDSTPTTATVLHNDQGNPGFSTRNVSIFFEAHNQKKMDDDVVSLHSRICRFCRRQATRAGCCPRAAPRIRQCHSPLTISSLPTEFSKHGTDSKRATVTRRGMPRERAVVSKRATASAVPFCNPDNHIRLISDTR